MSDIKTVFEVRITEIVEATQAACAPLLEKHHDYPRIVEATCKALLANAAIFAHIGGCPEYGFLEDARTAWQHYKNPPSKLQ